MNTTATRKQKAALLVVGLAIFLDMLIYGLVVPILPSYATSLGASQSDIGLLFGSYAVVLFIATPIFGALSDRIGRRGPLLWGLIGVSAATLLFAFAEQYWLLVAAGLCRDWPRQSHGRPDSPSSPASILRKNAGKLWGLSCPGKQPAYCLALLLAVGSMS